MQKKTEGQKDPYQSITVKLRRDAAFTASLEALCGERGVSLPALAREALIGKLRREGYLKEEERSTALINKALRVYGIQDNPEEGGGQKPASNRRTTPQERIRAVCFCLEQGGNYAAAAKACGVSYAQIYDWMKRYRERGLAGLEFTRGSRMPEGKMTQAQRMEAAVRLRQAEAAGQEAHRALCRTLSALEWGEVRASGAGEEG